MVEEGGGWGNIVAPQNELRFSTPLEMSILIF
jgi:hypothetical protein